MLSAVCDRCGRQGGCQWDRNLPPGWFSVRNEMYQKQLCGRCWQSFWDWLHGGVPEVTDATTS